MSSEASQPVKRLAIFASGGGSNAASIMAYFADREEVAVSLVVTNRPQAGVILRAHKAGVPVLILSKAQINDPEVILPQLRQFEIDLIALAGFLLLVPAFLIEAYPQKIVNIHPALLPKYGGKGMYGMHVHKAVKSAGDRVSGPTVHYVNEHYDEGAIIAQERVALDPEDSPEDIAAKVLKIEHVLYPRVIDRLLTSVVESST